MAVTRKRIAELVGYVDESLVDPESRYNARVAAFNQVIKNFAPRRRVLSPPKNSRRLSCTQGFVARQMEWNRRKSLAIEIERHKRDLDKLEAEKRASSSRPRARNSSSEIARIMDNLNRVKALLETS